MTDPLTAAREALAAYDEWLNGAGNCRFDTLPTHIRAALARVDELTAEVERLRSLLTTARQWPSHLWPSELMWQIDEAITTPRDSDAR